ncbi:hypothetical protein MUY27_15060 [Mucilaginibacter sp. RS28]|uniref:FHA domain-containing protein n=1 Tax=Mucilaginibacter straminoryzae TaxID=2932774 RepID=A0A9X2BA32_9SPHI|nr:hypothetical protein [Mucilaginibacter straminoryzae]MCJ8211036.1 hypothetical protein [Mucilaginibacter straminoryzae]
MESKPNFWERLGIQDWFLTSANNGKRNTEYALTPDDVYKYIVQKFTESIGDLSFADRVVFYHEFIIILSADDYRQFMDNKQGIFGLIVNECVKKFYEVLKGYREQGKTVVPSSSKWVFRLVSHPDYAKGDKGFIGKLLPESNTPKEENLRVTFIPRQTGIAQTFDISQDILKGFTYYSEGYYELPYEEQLSLEEKENVKAESNKTFARMETILPDKQFAGKKVEFLMREQEIIVSGADEEREGGEIFKIPSDWVNTPHLMIRYNNADGKLYMASFGEKTMLNENEVPASNIQSPELIPLPYNSRIILNGIVGINIYKN